MNFFAYREIMKKQKTAVFTGLDAENKKLAPGRRLLREAYAGVPGDDRQRVSEILKRTDQVKEFLVAKLMHNTDAATAGMKNMRVPTPEEVLEKFYTQEKNHVHPRILANSQTFSYIRSHKDEDIYRKWIALITEQGEAYLKEPFVEWMDVPKGSTRNHYLGACRMFKTRVQVLSMLYHITGDLRYAERAKGELLNFSSYPTYFPHSFLNVAETCFGFAIGYDWLYDLFTQAQREQLQTAVREKCFAPAYETMKTGDDWAGALHNWNQVCNGGIGIGALAMLEYEPKLCSELISFALKNIPRSLADIGPDGCYPEGPTYWAFGTTYATYFMAALFSVFGEDFGLSDVEGYKESASYIIYCTSPGGEIASYADTNNKYLRIPQTFWMAKRFQEPAYSWYARNIYTYDDPSETGINELLWYPQAPFATPQEAEYPLDMVYDGRENLAFFRKSWDDKDSIYVFFKGGDNQTNHGCLDIGQFVLDRFGIRWACDLKSENYSVPGYWDRLDGRWHYYRKRAEGHNTILINPGMGPDQDIFAACSIDTFGTSPEAAFAVCNMTEAYAAFGAERVRRGCMLFDDRNKLLIQDEISCQSESSIWWRMHTRVETVTIDGNRAILEKEGHTMTMTIQSPDAVFALYPAEPVPGSERNPNNSGDPDVKVLGIHLENTKHVTLRVVFTFDGDDALPDEMTIDDFPDFIQSIK